MASLERAERFGGAALVGVPAFEAFVSILDNYARLELLVRLHDHLPPFLVNPVTSFVCICIGLWLLHLSHQRQLKELRFSRLLDSSGMEYQRNDKEKWLIPVLVSFLIALVVTPVLAVGYSLSYKGNPPKTPSAPNTPYWAYETTPANPQARAKNLLRAIGQDNRGSFNDTNTQIGTTHAPVAIAPNGIANAAPNFGSQSVYNAPPERALVDPQRRAFISMMRTACPFEIAIRPVTGNAESMKYADALSAAIKDAGCTPRRPKFLIDTAASYGVSVALHDKDNIPAGADVLVTALKLLGTQPQGQVYDGLEPGVVYLMVGLSDLPNP